MFLLPSIAIGVVLAVLLGGRPSRVLEVRFRRQWAAFGALAIQVVVFSPLDTAAVATPLHLLSYALLFVFAWANVRNLALLPISLGMALNALAIAANGGSMPVSPSAWTAAGLGGAAETNVRVGGDHLAFLGDVFAIPAVFPLANVFSVGDLLIGFGMIAFIVSAATDDGRARAFVPRRLLEPFRVPSFRRLAAGKLVSHLGDWLTIAALVGWVYAETASIGHVSALILVRIVPPIVGGGVAAAIVDRLPRHRLLVTGELLRAAAVGSALLAVLGNVPVLAFAAVAVAGALAAVSAASVRSLLPCVLGRGEQLQAGNAGLGLAEDGAMALGAATGGILLATSGAAFALAVDLATFAVAAVLYSGLRVAVAPKVARGAGGGVLAGIRYVLSNRLVLVVVGAFGAATVATGLTNASLPRFLDDQVGLGPSAYGFGLAALAAGLAAGEAAAGLAHVGRSGGRWIGIALLLMSALFIALACTDHAPTALLVLAFIGFLDGTTDVLFDTIVQREADPAYHGRVFALSSAFFTTTMMAAVAAAPLANAVAAPHAVIMVAATGLAAAASVALFGTRPRAAPRLVPARVGSR